MKTTDPKFCNFEPDIKLFNIEQARDITSAFELVCLIEDVSESAFCALWLTGIEFTLWQEIYLSVDRQSEHNVILTCSQADLLRQLSQAAGGWVFWHDEHGETFIPFDGWNSMFQDWQSHSCS